MQDLSIFLSGLLCFSSKSLYPASVTAAMFALPKNQRSAWMLIGLPYFSCFKSFIFQCYKPVISFVVQEWDPPSTGVHLHTPTLLLQVALVQIKEGLYFRRPRLATRFESNLAKVLVKALLKLIIKSNIQEIQVVKNSQDHISYVFTLKIHHQNIKNAMR